MRSELLYNEFINIAKRLNRTLNITPILYCSLGLEVVTELEMSPQDIDILVPIRYIEDDWPMLKETMEGLEYKLVDLHEHKFANERFEVGFAFEEDLLPFAGVNDKGLDVLKDSDAFYRLLTVRDYLKVYRKSSIDGYRKTKNNGKDLKKIALLESLL
ncbi:hypothetical protein LC087_13205 [Bacillus carboniphilus]|uniref:Phosphoribosylanthranilate isomerase n=1 Tax=Bacillus carboniphilus TaxID=86663 RepID=A0ABY9JST3_9BACI|nr:hypothetical protein [Bacillus carboniphilus]WLR41798.1 hypothetical protein LC087_13205 [Bacillus carboniphilus]